MSKNTFRPVRLPNEPKEGKVGQMADARGAVPPSRGRLVGSGTTARGARPVLVSGIPYAGDPSRAKKCVAKGDTCEGWRVKGTELCAGHTPKEPTGDAG